MKKGEVIDRIKVGIFGLIAVALLTFMVFYIGSNRHNLGPKKRVTAIFKDVNGLKKGNSIRFSGVVIGTVEKIEIVRDSAIKVTFGLDEEPAKFIKKDSKAYISTEGLLGNKYIKITGGSPESERVKNGDMIATEEIMDLDQLVTSLGETGNNAKNFTNNLTEISDKLKNGQGTIGALLNDKKVYNGIEDAVTSITNTGKNTQKLTNKMITMVDTLQTAGGHTIQATKNLKEFTRKLNNDSSTLGRLISDTAMAQQVTATMTKVGNAADEVTTTSGKVRESWLLKLFSKNKNKKQKTTESEKANKSK